MTFLTLGGKVRQSEKHSAEATFTVNKRRIPILCKKKEGGMWGGEDSECEGGNSNKEIDFYHSNWQNI